MVITHKLLLAALWQLGTMKVLLLLTILSYFFYHVWPAYTAGELFVKTMIKERGKNNLTTSEISSWATKTVRSCAVTKMQWLSCPNHFRNCCLIKLLIYSTIYIFWLFITFFTCTLKHGKLVIKSLVSNILSKFWDSTRTLILLANHQNLNNYIAVNVS